MTAPTIEPLDAAVHGGPSAAVNGGPDRLAPAGRASRRRLLFITHRLPYPPDKGERLRSYHFLRHLASRHDVWCASFVDETSRPGDAEVVGRLCKGLRTVPWTRWRAAVRAGLAVVDRRCYSEAAYFSPAMHDAVSAWSAEAPFDAVVACSSVMAPYALAARARRRILDYCDMDSQKWTDYARVFGGRLARLWAAEGCRLRDAEVEWSRRADLTLLINERERQAMLPRVDPERIAVVRNGVAVPESTEPAPERLGPVVGFLGAMNYRPNVDGVRWFLARVWPTVRTFVPAARFRVIGRDPVRALRRLDGRDGVEVTGYVDDVAAALRTLRLGVAPLRVARGLQNKVLEVLAAGRPVIATTVVCDGLQLQTGRDLLRIDHPLAFARQTARLLKSDDECRDLGRAGRTAVLRAYDWSRALRAFEAAVLGQCVPVANPAATTLPLADRAPATPAREPENPLVAAVVRRFGGVRQVVSAR